MDDTDVTGVHEHGVHEPGVQDGVHNHGHAPPDEPTAAGGAYEQAAGIFRAVGDVERLRLLARLAAGERCVTELADAAGAGLSTVSQRLRVLRAEGLVVRRRDGKHVYYSLADGHVAELVSNALAHAGDAPRPPHRKGARQ
ncbi:MAG TPA: helix-turn-helix domain-containing protein [Egibacteraceae bacterium]|nr:helix-turn-helix domain-containing protein [Egibacteraceae bacterium]